MSHVNEKSDYHKVNVLKKIQDRLFYLDYRLNDTRLDSHKFHKYLGEKEALETNQNKRHESLVRNLMKAKSELLEMKDDKELYEMEILFWNGYLHGIEFILNTNRHLLDTPVELRLIGITENEELANLLEFAFNKLGFITSFEMQSGLSCYITTNVDEVSNQLEKDSVNTQLIVFITPNLRTKLKKPLLDDMTVLEDTVHILKKKENDHIMVRKLFDNKLDSFDISNFTFVTINTVANIESIIRKTLLSFTI